MLLLSLCTLMNTRHQTLSDRKRKKERRWMDTSTHMRNGGGPHEETNFPGECMHTSGVHTLERIDESTLASLQSVLCASSPAPHLRMKKLGGTHRKAFSRSIKFLVIDLRLALFLFASISIPLSTFCSSHTPRQIPLSRESRCL